AAPFNPRTQSFTGQVRPIGPASAPTNAGIVHFSMSSDGTLAYALGPIADYGNELAWFYPDGRVEPIYRSKGPIHTLRLSPDARFIAFTALQPAPGLWVYDTRRGTPLRLLQTESVGFPVWHPDGKRMAVEVGREGFNVIAMVSANGTSEPEIIYADPQK